MFSRQYYKFVQSVEPTLPMFLDGKAGQGKSYIVECLTWLLQSQEHIVLVTDSTALSVIGYDCGRTAHSTFRIRIKEDNSDISCRVQPMSGQAKLICAAKLIIWDELPMANCASVEAVDTLLQNLKGSSLPFGGAVFLGLGNFQQVAPVIKNQYKTTVLDSSIQSSYLCRHFNILRLHSSIQNACDPDFSVWVDSIGEDSNQLGTFDVTSQAEILSIDSAKQWLFLKEDLSKLEVCAQHAYLTPLNVDVDEFNATVFDTLDAPLGNKPYC